MKNTILKKTMPLAAAITGGTRSVASAIRRFALVAAAICVAATPLSSFAEAKEVTLKASGYAGSETLTGFQALVKLSEGGAYRFSYTEAGGSTATNIWFTSEDGTTVYPHEIDRWDTSGNSFVWVRLPELKKGTTFKMHWSDSSGDVQPASGNVWDGFVGVWHMNEDGTTSAPDSTANGIGAAPVDSSGTSTSIGTATGKVGAGRAVTQGTMLKVTGHASNGRISDARIFTIGGWVKRTTDGGEHPRVFVGNVNSTRNQWEIYCWTDSKVITKTYIRGGTTDWNTSALKLDVAAGWHYVTAVYNGTKATLYDNGARVNEGTVGNATQGDFFTFGGWTGRNDRSFVGTFDEVRMYNGVLSADRIAADYATMNNPTTFIKLVGEVVNEDLPYGALSAEPDLYVQTGLIAHFDGIRNAGLGQAHALSSSIPSGATDGMWTCHGYFFMGKQYFAIGGAINLDKAATVQLATEWTTSIGDCSGVSWPLIFGGSSSDADKFGIWHDKNALSTNFKVLDNKKSAVAAHWDGYFLNAVYDGANSRYSLTKNTSYNWLTGGANGSIKSSNTSYVIGTAQSSDGSKSPRMFKGIVKSVRIYDRILTTDELAWNRVIDEVRFRGFVTNGVVVVASNIGVVGGTEANGTYYVNGSHTFTAPASVTVGSTTYELQGYTLERYDDSTQTWVKEGTYSEASFAYKHSETSTGVRLTWNWHSPNEPDAYLDYVESDGRQVFDTGVTPGPTTSVTPAVTSMTVDADLEWISGGCMASSGYNDFHPLRNVNGKIGAAFKNSGNSVVNLPSGKDLNSGRCRVVTTVEQNKQFTVTVDGTTVNSGNNTVVARGSGRTLYAFASNNGSAAGSDHSTAKLYGMKIYINGVLVRDYVPGIKNGVAGLYDRQNDEWHHSGSGIELIPGPVVNPQNLPDAYLDYVKSTGAQWVSVGITPTQTMKFDVDVDWISGNALMAQSNYGLSPLTVNNGTIVSRWWMADSAASANTGVGLDTGRRRFVITTSNAAYVSTSVDGGTPALSGGYSNRSGVNPSDLYIFAVHYGGTVGNAGEYSTAKLYGLKIYGANGALMRDYVPGIKDNVVGLYDRVNDKFFSSGSGTPLVAGPVVDRSKPDSFVEYVESNGSQWVDTGVDGRAGVKSEADIDWISGNAPLGVIGNNHCLLLQALGTIGGQALGSGEIKTGIALDSGRHLIVSEAPAGSQMTITVDGTTAQSPSNVSAGDTGMTIWMFAAHGSGGKWGEGASKFYELKLWRTGSDGVCRIQRHFIPCVKGSRAGLYDAVSGVIFYSHSGTDLVASSTPRTLSVWRNEADDASLDNAANWCGNLPNGTDAEVCAPWVPAVSSTNGLAFANLTVSGGNLAFADGTNTVAGVLAADGALAFTNLVINGSADCAVAISGFISGHGTVKSLTLAEGARFIPDGVGYLTVSDALDGTILIDMTGIDLSGVTGRFPLFKTGTAEILPTADAVEFVGGRAPSGRSLIKVKSGFGYDLNPAGFFILLR